MSKLNAAQMKMLAEVKKRQVEHFSFKEFGYGLSVASQYVKGWSNLGSVKSSSYLKDVDIAEAIKRADNTFTWCDGEQPDQATKAGDDFFDDGASLSKFKLPEGVEVPTNALMVFRNVITTNAEDRDGDVLHTAGAKLDQPMPLLWQHLSALPIGKMLAVDSHTEKMLRVFSVLLDMNELTEDTAKLIEAKVLRISHGFIPLKFTERETDSKDVPWRGFDIKEFEVMEESTVSVPSNRAAVIDMFSRNAFKSPIMRGIGKELFDNRVDKIYPGFTLLKVNREDDIDVDADDNIDAEIDYLIDPSLINTNGKDEPIVAMSITETVGDVSKSHEVVGLDAIKTHLEKLNLTAKGGRELSKANIQLLRDVIDDLVELKSAEGMSRSHVALLNKNISALSTLIDKSIPEETTEPVGEHGHEHGKSDEAFYAFRKRFQKLDGVDQDKAYKALFKFITFDADDDQLKIVEELLATRKEIQDSIQVGNEFRTLVNS